MPHGLVLKRLNNSLGIMFLKKNYTAIITTEKKSVTLQYKIWCHMHFKNSYITEYILSLRSSEIN